MLFVSGLFGSVKPAINKNISWGIELELSPDTNMPCPFALGIQKIPKINPSKPKIQNLVIFANIPGSSSFQIRFLYSSEMKKGVPQVGKRVERGGEDPKAQWSDKNQPRHHRGNRFGSTIHDLVYRLGLTELRVLGVAYFFEK